MPPLHGVEVGVARARWLLIIGRACDGSGGRLMKLMAPRAELKGTGLGGTLPGSGFFLTRFALGSGGAGVSTGGAGVITGGSGSCGTLRVRFFLAGASAGSSPLPGAAVREPPYSSALS